MTTKIVAPQFWSTACFGETADASLRELSALGEHLHLCRALNGRMFALRCRIEVVHRFVVARFVTTLVMLALAVAVISVLLL